MLHAVIWNAFFKLLFLLTILYYGWLLTRKYPKDAKDWLKRLRQKT